MSEATRPDSNAPNSLEVPTNSMLTADTRPRRASGASRGTLHSASLKKELEDLVDSYLSAK